MQTSKKKGSRPFLVRLLIFIVIAVLVNLLITFIPTPYSSPASEMWSKFRAREPGALSMVYVGTSQCYEGVDPVVADAASGYSSQNMGTNAQSFADSRRAIQEALEKQPVKRVVLLLDYMYMEEGKERYSKPESAFIYAENQGQPLTARIRNSASFIFDSRYVGKPASVAFFFPWLMNINKVRSSIPLNVMAKLGLVTLQGDDRNNLRTPEGFKGFHNRINYNLMKRQVRETWSRDLVSEESLGLLDSICGICREHGAKLTVVVAPVPVSATLRYGDSYYDRLKYVTDFFAERGVDFFDMNMATHDFYPRQRSDFRDIDHLNIQGARVFSNSLGTLIRKLDAGEDVSDCFYDREGFEASINYIETVNIRAKAGKNGITVKAGSYHGSGVRAEYRFVVKGPDDERAYEISPYSTKREIHFRPGKHGTYVFRVYARPEGSHIDYDCTYATHVSWWG